MGVRPMLRLGLKTEPHWLDLLPTRAPGAVRVKVRPLTTAEYEAAKIHAGRAVRRLAEEAAERRMLGQVETALPDPDDEAAVLGLSQAYFLTGLAQAAIVEWEGVGDADGNELPPTRANVARLMQVPFIAEAFATAYTAPYEGMFAEGNALPPSPDGTSVPGPGAGTAEAAPTPVPSAPGADAVQTVTAAPIASMP